MNQKINFIYFNRVYPIELSIFNKYSNFFSIENKMREDGEKINLLNEFDFYKLHTEESVTEFLKYCQDQPINLQVNNVISIQALSMKYFVDQLQKDTDLFIEKHYKEVIEYYFSKKEAIIPIYEKLISTHLIEYLQDDRLYQLPISTLYRIQRLFLDNIKKAEKSKTDQIQILSHTIINFLIKTVYSLKEKSIIFIKGNKFNQEQIQYLNTQMSNIEDENTIDILTRFLQSNSSYIIESKKNKKLLKDFETRKYEKIIEALKMKREQSKLKYKGTFEKVDDKLQQLFNKFDILQPIIIPDVSDKISEKQFERFPIRRIIIPNSIQCIETKAFNECSSLIEIEIPVSVKFICAHSFSGCSNLHKIKIDPYSTEIQEGAFDKCILLNEIISSSKERSIITPYKLNEYFERIGQITSLSFSSNIEKIESRAFSKCTSLREIIIPKSVKFIGERCFEGCIKINKITIDPFCTEITPNSFDGSLFSEIVIMSNKTEQQEQHCKTRLKTDEKTETALQAQVFYHTNINEIFFNEQNLEMQNRILNMIVNMKHNENNAIIGQIRSIFAYLLNEVYQAKKDFTNFVNIRFYNYGLYITKEMTEILCLNGTFIRRDLYSLFNILQEVFFEFKYPTCNFNYIYNIPKNNIFKIAIFICHMISENSSSVSSIDYSKFSGYSFLTQISISSSVTSIGCCAFRGCSSLTQITIPSSVTSIGNYAFSECSSLTQITFEIPSSVTSIGYSAFYNCSSLTQISIPSSVISIGYFAFERCLSLTQITFEIPSSVTSIGDFAFRDCLSLTQISIPSSVKSIGYSAFSGCLSLTQNKHASFNHFTQKQPNPGYELEYYAKKKIITTHANDTIAKKLF